MIVRMNKYTFVVLDSEREEFLERLQSLGLVDVTVGGWEPTDEERAQMGFIERHREAVEYLTALRGSVSSGSASGSVEPFDTGAEAFEKYETARERSAALETEIAHNEKLAEEARPWGEFDPARLGELADRGIVMRYFTASASEFGKRREEWSRIGAVEKIGEAGGTAYFVVVSASASGNVVSESAGESFGRDVNFGENADTNINAQEARLPEESFSSIEARLAQLRAERKSWDGVFARAAASVDAIEAEGERLKDTLQFRQTTKSGEKAADGALVVMEAWAREKQEKEVDAMLEECPEVLFIKERPTPDDQTPVELHNRKFARPFELIGEMYALPRYGSMDLTRWFAPFYMLFFAFCLSDAGYGLLIFLGGLLLTLKSEGTMKTIGKLSMWCGGASVVFGFFVGSLFGLDFKTWSIFAEVKDKIFFPHGPDDSMFMFILALALGVFQMVFGMILKAVTTARAFGIMHAMSTIGWIIVILSGGAFVLKTMEVVPMGGIPDLAFYIAMGVGGFMMLFLNNPGKNPLVNLGGGLWNTYNDVTGFLSDALSYIRLFAIGLSGGVLATVFNNLAQGMSGDIPVVKQLIMLVILLIGHGLNLFMSALSSMVHPLRLTFVEFYKNSGFEMAPRTFSPLKKQSKKQ